MAPTKLHFIPETLTTTPWIISVRKGIIPMSSKEEAYLFVPYDEDYYQAMSQRIERRFANWQGLHIGKDTVEPDELARAFMDYLDCEYLFPIHE